MKKQIKVENLKKKKLFIATPMYGGQCHGLYAKASNDLAMFCAQHGIDIRFYYLFNESLITRARNYCVDEFLRSDYTHLMFIDSDIHFNYQDVLVLMDLCDEENDYDVITGPYPKKTIAWEKIQRASELGHGGKDPHDLAHFMGDFVFNPVHGNSFRLDEPVEIREGGTGFMMIKRRVLEKYEEAYPELKYKPDHVRTEHFDGTREITAFFDTIIDPESKRYLSEDYMFSHNVRKIGLKVWLCPWMQLRHIGSFMFQGSMHALAAIQASPTATAESNRKFYQQKQQEQKPVIPQVSPQMNRKERRAAKKKGK